MLGLRNCAHFQAFFFVSEKGAIEASQTTSEFIIFMRSFLYLLGFAPLTVAVEIIFLLRLLAFPFLPLSLTRNRSFSAFPKILLMISSAERIYDLIRFITLGCVPLK